jgi:hypothetical protein
MLRLGGDVKDHTPGYTPFNAHIIAWWLVAGCRRHIL